MNDAGRRAASTPSTARQVIATRDRAPDLDQRVLAMVGKGEDEALARRAAEMAGVQLCFVGDMSELASAIGTGAGAALLSDTLLAEAMSDAGLAALRRVLARQRKWSELPFIVMFGGDEPAATVEKLELHTRVKLVLLHRPVPAISLASALASALKSRRRQYEVRDLLSRLNKDVRLRDQYLAMLGHELRNPLNSIGYVAEIFSMAGDSLTPAQTRWGAEVIGRQLRHLARLLDQLLDVARVQRGKIRLEAATVDVRTVARRCAQGFEPAEKRRNFVMSLPKQPVLVRGDPLRLMQIVESLLDNAFKYTDEDGEIRLVLRADGEAVLTVRDDGHGIKPATLPYVFEPFFQEVGAPRAEAGGGLGLGLAMADNLTRLHGGRISARSAGVGKGAEFEVRLPLGEAAEVPGGESDVPGRALHLLVIEDDVDSADALALLLKSLGHDARVAYDGESAMHEMEDHDFDLVIVDIGLPDMPGEEVAERIRRQLAGSAPRLVALTGRLDGIASDVFDAFLLKPVRRDQVESLLVGEKSF